MYILKSNSWVRAIWGHTVTGLFLDLNIYLLRQHAGWPANQSKLLISVISNQPGMRTEDKKRSVLPDWGLAEVKDDYSPARFLCCHLPAFLFHTITMRRTGQNTHHPHVSAISWAAHKDPLSSLQVGQSMCQLQEGMVRAHTCTCTSRVDHPNWMSVGFIVTLKIF